MSVTEEDNELLLEPQDQRLIELIRCMKSGELNILVADGKPVCAEEIRTNIDL